MWLRSDKRELRNRNQAKEKFINYRKKRKRSRNQYCKTIKLMKNEKKASVLTTKQYSSDELTLYNDKALKATKIQTKVVTQKIFTTNNNNNKNNNLSYTTSDSIHTSVVNQYHHHSYDLNNLDIDLNNIRTSSIDDDAVDENTALDYGNNASAEHFQPLNTHQYDDYCNANIHTVPDMLISE